MTVNAAGSYFWIASYSGDANNDPVSGTCGDAGETSVVSPASPAISTSATNAIAGGTIQDTATLSGGTNPTGTITFQLFSDAQCQNQVGQDDVVAVSGNGDYTSAAVTVNAAGSYFWIASYSGDANNDPVSGTCGDAGETSVVTAETGQDHADRHDLRAVRGRDRNNLTDLFYGKKGNKINNISPGVFFYYSKITAPASPFTIQVTQSNTLGWKPIGTMQLILWDANCVKTSVRGTFNPNTGTVTFNATGLTTGATYYISVKYAPGTLVGQQFGSPTNVYTFLTSINGSAVVSSQDSVNVRPKF